ncbi:MAG: hypothetical protein H6577_24855 [Lewinellaceae bacterium]|nr:hypothetical protein [Saprospiraceae bacterium]MCB9341367.1 hypothetical protein [Lewinellaceae bacterium]
MQGEAALKFGTIFINDNLNPHPHPPPPPSQRQPGNPNGQESLMLSPGIGAAIGMGFQMAERWRFNVETIPTFSYNHVIKDETPNQRFGESDGFTTDFQAIYLGLAYRFSKKK